MASAQLRPATRPSWPTALRGQPHGIEYGGRSSPGPRSWPSSAARRRSARSTPRGRGLRPAHRTLDPGVVWSFVILVAALGSRPAPLDRRRSPAPARRSGLGGRHRHDSPCLLVVRRARAPNVPDSGGETFAFDGVRVAAGNLLWPLQAVAAFPMRDEAAPPVVYALWLLPLVTLPGPGDTGGQSPGTEGCSARARCLDLVPTVLTAATYSMMGTAWQGRYSLPLYVGLPLLAGAVASGHYRLRAGHVRLVIGMTAAATAVAWPT